jgi:hypothetical protein
MNDLTILYISASEMPEHWTWFQVEHFFRAAKGYDAIAVVRKPIDEPDFIDIIDDDGPKSYWNIYMQMLRAAKLATTPFVAMAEDDVLYTPEHFSAFRPPMDSVSYDRSRWSLFSWESDPIYCLRQRISNCSLIAPREYLIDALEERATKHPNGLPNGRVGEVGRRSIEKGMGVSPRNMVEWYCQNPIVQLNHLTGTDIGDYPNMLGDGRNYYKKHGEIKAVEIPFWGPAKEIVKHYAPDGQSNPNPILVSRPQQEPALVSA